MFKEFVFPAYVRMAGARRSKRRRQKSTERGRLLQTGTLICAALGLDTDLNLVYQVFALLVALIVISRTSLYFARPDVSVSRQLPRYATAGEPFTYSIVLTNEGDRVERDLRVEDPPKNRVPTLAEFRASREPGEATRNAYDRWIGFHRFMWLMRIKTGMTTRPADVPDIGIRARVPVPIEATPVRRGIVTLQSTQVLHPDPMGLAYGVIDCDNPETLTVLPRRYQISERFEIPGGRHFQPGGVNSSWSIGESDEFASMRDYRDGDSMRKIHWASSAKRNKLVVKEYQEDYLVRQALMLETETADTEVLEEAISLAASLLLKESDSDSMLDLIYHSDQPEVISSGRGADSIGRQLEALASLSASEATLETLIDATLGHAGELSGCILILTTWDGRRQALVDRVRAAGITCQVIVVAREPASLETPADVRVLDANAMESEVARL